MKMIKKKIISLILIITLILGGFSNNSIFLKLEEVSAASLNQTKATINVGDTLRLHVDGASGSIEWKTSNKKVCDVDGTGLVTPKKRGKAVIKAVINGSETLSCKVKVRACYTISKKSKLMDVGKNKYSKYSSAYVNKYTRDWYLFRSHLEKLEKLGGGTLVVKKGTYNITSVLCIPSNVNIIFKKGAKINKTSNTHTSKFKASKTLFELVPVSKYNKKNWAKKYNGVKNVKIIGEGKNEINMNYYHQGVAVTIFHSTNISISGISFKNINEAHSIELDAGKDINISNCKFSGQKGSNLSREAINLDIPEKFDKTWSACDKTNNDGIVIKNCKFKNLYVGVGSHYYSYNNSANSQIYHNNVTVENCTFNNMKKFGVHALNWANCKVSNCTFDKVSGGKGDVCGIMGRGSQRLDCTGNTFKNIVNSGSEKGFGIKVVDYELGNSSIPRTYPTFVKGSGDEETNYFEKSNNYENVATKAECKIIKKK